MAKKLPVDLQAVPTSTPLSNEEVLRLEAAAYQDYHKPVTAYLTSVNFKNGICLGVVWGHERAEANGQFADGHRICTSEVVAIEQIDAFPVVVTRNSRYVLVSFHPDCKLRWATVH